jgi:hypothetical protein
MTHRATSASRLFGIALGAAALALGLALPAGANTHDEPSATHAMTDRERLMAHMERLPEQQLKRAYLLCAHTSGQRLLDPAEAALCSMAAEVLKKLSFNGDFNALLAWWHANRHAEPTSEHLDDLLAL